MAVPPGAGSADENAGARPFILFQSVDDETEVKNSFRADRAQGRAGVKITAGGVYTSRLTAAKVNSIFFVTKWRTSAGRAKGNRIG
jgi:hypothetical protein